MSQPPQWGGGPQGPPYQQQYPQQYPPQGWGPPPPKKTSGAAMAILGIAGACVACMVFGAVGKSRDGTGPSSSAPPAQRQYVTQSCSEVAHLFGTRSRMTELQQNELWRQYDEKWVRWQLTVGEIRESFGGYQMQFRCGTESLVFDGHAYFPASERERLLALQPGATIPIEGRLADHGRFLGLSIRDASITQ